jgi:hypothetical protein
LSCVIHNQSWICRLALAALFCLAAPLQAAPMEAPPASYLSKLQYGLTSYVLQFGVMKLAWTRIHRH